MRFKMTINRRAGNRAKIRRALSEGEKTFGELLEETGLSSPTLSEHLKEMEGKGTLSSERDPDDRRRRIYKLPLPSGREGELLRELDGQLGEPLTGDEVDELDELLSEEVIEALEEISKISVGSEVSLLDGLWFYDAEREELDLDEIEDSVADPERMREVAETVWLSMLPPGKAKEGMEKALEGVDVSAVARDNLPAECKANKYGVESELDELAGRIRKIADERGGGVVHENRKKAYDLYVNRLWSLIWPEFVKKMAESVSKSWDGEH